MEKTKTIVKLGGAVMRVYELALTTVYCAVSLLVAAGLVAHRR